MSTSMDRRNILSSSRYRSGSREQELDDEDLEFHNSLNYGSKVSQLKNMFQMGQVGVLHSDEGEREKSPRREVPAAVVRGSPQRDQSPDHKRKRGNVVGDSCVNKSPAAVNIERGCDSLSTTDPNKYFESTNHVQRFNITRAMFARMEEESKTPSKPIELPRRRVKVSPSRLDQQTPKSGSTGNLLDERKPRSSSDPSEMECIADNANYYYPGSTRQSVEQPRKNRSSSTADVRLLDSGINPLDARRQWQQRDTVGKKVRPQVPVRPNTNNRTNYDRQNSSEQPVVTMRDKSAMSAKQAADRVSNRKSLDEVERYKLHRSPSPDHRPIIPHPYDHKNFEHDGAEHEQYRVKRASRNNDEQMTGGHKHNEINPAAEIQKNYYHAGRGDAVVDNRRNSTETSGSRESLSSTGSIRQMWERGEHVGSRDSLTGVSSGREGSIGSRESLSDVSPPKAKSEDVQRYGKVCAYPRVRKDIDTNGSLPHTHSTASKDSSFFDSFEPVGRPESVNSVFESPSQQQQQQQNVPVMLPEVIETRANFDVNFQPNYNDIPYDTVSVTSQSSVTSSVNDDAFIVAERNVVRRSQPTPVQADVSADYDIPRRDEDGGKYPIPIETVADADSSVMQIVLDEPNQKQTEDDHVYDIVKVAPRPVEEPTSADFNDDGDENDGIRSWAKNRTRYSPRVLSPDDQSASSISSETDSSPSKRISDPSYAEYDLISGNVLVGASISGASAASNRDSVCTEYEPIDENSPTVENAPVLTKAHRIDEEEQQYFDSDDDEEDDADAVKLAEPLNIQQEDGDGDDENIHSFPLGPQEMEVEDGVHILEDGNFFYDISGLPPDDTHEYLPSTKKATKIRFSNAPIRVYSTYSVNEYDRRNEDVDPVAASAEYELEKRIDRMDVFPVDLMKGPEGLGLSIIGMGVGADAGLEKLGIFIKTLTEGGAAQKDGRIFVNDQIIEVDGKSLVGVTQAYAASVLRNTSGKVCFLIGREKNPEKSEVARLIQQSLDQDKQRQVVRRREQERQHEIRQELRREEEELQQKQQLQQEQQERLEMEREASEIREPEVSPEDAPIENSMEDISPVDGVSGNNIEVFDLEESSSESITPDMDAQVLFIKLKEAQYKNAVAEAEVAKLKARLILLDNIEVQKKNLEKKCEDLSKRMRDTELNLQNSTKQMAEYQEGEKTLKNQVDLLEGSQGQYIMLEKKMQNEYGALEKKYHKAKKLIKDYQQREKDLLQEREAFMQVQSERDQQYNQLVKSLKDRIFELEKNLAEAQKAAGIPVAIPKELSVKDGHRIDVTPSIQSVIKVTAIQQLVPDYLSEASSESELDMSPEEEKVVQQENGHVVNSQINLEEVPDTELLDVSAAKTKAQLANTGAMATRKPPTNTKKILQDGDDLETEVVSENLEPFIKHDRFLEDDDDSTVKKRKPPAQHSPSSASPSPPSAPPSSSSYPVNNYDQYFGSVFTDEIENSDDSDEIDDFTNSHDEMNSNRDAQSDTSSISQVSYEPSQPVFRGMSSEIPESVDAVDGGVMLVSAKPISGTSSPKLSSSTPTRPQNKIGKSFLSKLANSLDTSGDSSSGITLISSKPLDTGYSGGDTLNSSNVGLVREYDDDNVHAQSYNFASMSLTSETVSSSARKGSNQWQSAKPVHEWTIEQVCHWLIMHELDHYKDIFIHENIDGSKLLLIDGARLKTMGIVNSNDRNAFKRKLKELKSNMEKEKKRMEKEAKKDNSSMSSSIKKKKMFTFGKS
ncbi:uncharacterized protein LOC141904968 isoform X4 [Tubulanus polymorphus]|uniref:uncharacterized protein LOC141904968 isoform X4 n=1 Tax=Tubulanus polymorphus TaxID=672921 RepID=UPI003DA47690